jgi:5-keto 4-deoxyuronate isomerase
MYPKELVIRGGRDSFMNVQKRIERSGIGIITSIIFGDQGKIVPQGKRLFCMLNDTIYVTGGFDIKIKARGAMIAVSEDNGKQWYFIDTDWALRIFSRT